MTKKTSYKNTLQDAKSFLNQRKYVEALEIFEVLRKEQPDNPETIFGTGVCLFFMEEHAQALGCFIKASELEPENAEYILYMGHCLQYTDQKRLAISQYEKVLEIDSSNFDALSHLGYLYKDRHRNPEAAEVLKKAVNIRPSNAVNQANFGETLAKLGNYEEAIKHANKAIRLDPKNLSICYMMGHIHMLHGDQIEAERFFKKAIELDATYGPAYYALATKKITNEDRPLITKMEKVLNQSMSLYNRQQILFALGKAYNDIKETDKAFAYIHKANNLNNSEFDSLTHNRILRKTKKYFDKQFFNQLSYQPDTGCTPIFIVGMPRSGSTLIDQILSAHSSVFSGGESAALDDIISLIADETNSKKEYPACLSELSQQQIKDYSEKYIQKIVQGENNATHIVDKNLFNYINLGLIAMLFPNAKIIHAKRHPLDTALSCYMTSFAFELFWTTNLKSIAKYYLDYTELMHYWQKTLPIHILDVQYEDLVENPEENVRRILDFCDLNWEDGCLDFHNSKRSVNTASIWQVRQPVYKSSVQRWVPYAKHLQPLIFALGDILEADYEKIESLGLKHGPRHNNPLNKISKIFK